MNLTPRQLECLELAAQGLSAKQIARHLGVTEYTVKNHRREILESVRAKNTAQAVAILIYRGLIGRCSVVVTEAESIVVSGRAAWN